MSQSSTTPIALPTRQIIRELLHNRITETISAVVEEELSDLLGSARYERSGDRRGYRNGHVQRTVTTEVGPREIAIPRARIVDRNGSSSEFRSEILPRYARRTRKVDSTILGVYLAGANTRRIRRALMPLLGEANLSKSAVSRVVARLKGLFADWSGRELHDELYPILILDAIHLKVRLARRVVSAPVLVVMGVDDAGNKRLVALQLAVSEAAANWSNVVADLSRRGLPSPILIVSDGHKGLTRAIAAWPDAKVQRCTIHKRANLESHCPVHARNELVRDYTAIVDADDALAARKAYCDFISKWKALCPPVVRSLEEAGEHLLTFYDFPKPMWVSLRTTNSIENLNREFRRRTKTQASFPSESAALTLLYGLIVFDQIRMRKINGFQHVASLMEGRCRDAA
jgi:transposase-like protein